VLSFSLNLKNFLISSFNHFFICSSFRGTIAKKWLLWIMLQETCSVSDLVSIGCTPRSVITRSYCNSSSNCLKNVYTIFHNGCTNLNFYHQWIRILFFPHHHQYLLSSVFLKTCFLRGVK
jgi:hypothetical protein